MDPLTIAMLISAGASALGASGLTQPDVNNKQPAPPAGGGGMQNPAGDFLQNFTPGESHGGGNGSQYSPVQTPPVNMPQAGPAPAKTDMEGIDPQGSPQGNAKKNQKMNEIGDLIASIPEALAIAAPLLGLGPDQNRKQTAPTAGGGGMNPYAQSMGALPRPPSLGELLAALPRMR